MQRMRLELQTCKWDLSQYSEQLQLDRKLPILRILKQHSPMHTLYLPLFSISQWHMRSRFIAPLQILKLTKPLQLS